MRAPCPIDHQTLKPKCDSSQRRRVDARDSGTARQGYYRCDIHWDDDPSDLLWMIRPMFLDEQGQELPKGTDVPQVSRAHFYIVNAELRATVHQAWLHAGAGFHLCEGARRVAACRVATVFTHAKA